MDSEVQEPTEETATIEQGAAPSAMTVEETTEAVSLADLDRDELAEVIRHFRAVRNDLLHFGAWNNRNLTEDEFKQVSDERLFGYFKQDLLETRIVDRGRRVNVVEVWRWFDDLISGVEPLFIDGEEVMLNIRDKDIEKLRTRMRELHGFLPTLRNDDFSSFRRIKYKLRRTVMRMTYDLHNLNKRLEKYRKNRGARRDSITDAEN
ncbi:MAG: hypothetical protein KY459_00510 [Acidobacteria bacterium]|nr:hypothetical protein [Acidobacteriota bacterium]